MIVAPIRLRRRVYVFDATRWAAFLREHEISSERFDETLIGLGVACRVPAATEGSAA